MKILISEAQASKLLMEYYDSDKLYSREYVVNRLMKGPKELKKYIKDLPNIECTDSQGNIQNCTKIPEVVYIYFSGKY
jgi:hypothetical protein